jgi:hypothetical protein
MGNSKSGGAGTTYDYFGTLAGVISIGQSADLLSIILNGQEAWPQGTPWSVGLNCVTGAYYVYDGQTWICSTAATATAANAPGGTDTTPGWTEFTFARTTENFDNFTLLGSDGTVQGTMNFYWGTAAQTVDPSLESTGNDGGINGNFGHGDQHPNYAGVVYVVIGPNFLLGEEVQSGPNVEIVTRRVPNQTVITGAAAGIFDGQANLAAVAVELLTNENCLGLSSAVIDATSFQATANYLQTNQQLYGASVLIDASETITSIFDKLTQMYDGYIRFNPATQLIEMGVYEHGVTPAAYTLLTADSFTKFPKFSSKSWQDTISRATVRYMDRILNYQETSVQVDDPRAFFVLGAVREQSLDRPWITRQAQAQLQGQEFLRVVGHAQMTGELEVRREIGRNIRAGDYVLVDVDLEPNSYTITQFFRVTKRKIPPNGPITLSVFADNTLSPVPWRNAQSPVTISAPVVPPITAFRFLEVPTILSGQRGAIICLAQRPNNLLVGATLYFDTSTTGTFSSDLGAFSNFAAKATLYAAVAAADATIQLTVDTTQVDADYFTQQFAALQQVDDEMLAFIVSSVAGGADAGEVAESAGYQVMEICSVGAQTLISAGQYNLSVLRGRKNTQPTAFTIANTEVWLIPAALLSFFNSTSFDQIRANRLAGLTPAYAQFRICPYTFVDSLALSSAVSEQFRFPLNSASAPSLTLSHPLTFAVAIAPSAYPSGIQVKGIWTDPDSNLVEVKVLLRKSTDTADRLVSDMIFAPTSNYAFSSLPQIDSAGNWTIKLIARDSTNLVTERDLTVTAAAGAPVCALPDVFDSAGNQILDASGTPFVGGVASYSAGTSLPSGWPGGTSYLSIVPDRYIPYGPLSLNCTTPGATITFWTMGPVLSGGAISTPGGGQTYVAGVTTPFQCPIGLRIGSGPGPFYPSPYVLLAVQATAPGFTNSSWLVLVLPLLTQPS